MWNWPYTVKYNNVYKELDIDIVESYSRMVRWNHVTEWWINNTN